MQSRLEFLSSNHRPRGIDLAAGTYLALPDQKDRFLRSSLESEILFLGSKFYLIASYIIYVAINYLQSINLTELAIKINRREV